MTWEPSRSTGITWEPLPQATPLPYSKLETCIFIMGLSSYYLSVPAENTRKIRGERKKAFPLSCLLLRLDYLF